MSDAPTRPRRRVRGARTARTAFAAITLALIIAAGHHLFPTYPQQSRMFTVTASGDGAWATGRTSRARIQSYRVADSIVDSSGTSTTPLQTSGIWVIVRLEAEAVDEPTSRPEVELVSPDGTRWSESDRAGTQFAYTPLAVDIPVSGQVVFEMPRRRLPGIALHMFPQVEQLDSELVLPLRISRARARDLLRDAPRRVTLTDTIRIGTR